MLSKKVTTKPKKCFFLMVRIVQAVRNPFAGKTLTPFKKIPFPPNKPQPVNTDVVVFLLS